MMVGQGAEWFVWAVRSHNIHLICISFIKLGWLALVPLGLGLFFIKRLRSRGSSICSNSVAVRTVRFAVIGHLQVVRWVHGHSTGMVGFQLGYLDSDLLGACMRDTVVLKRHLEKNRQRLGWCGGWWL